MDAVESEALTLTQAMQRAAAAYEERDWAQAERIGRLILAVEAGHFDALTLLGVIAARTDRAHEAASFFGRAAAVNDIDPGAHYNLGVTLQRLGRFREAVESYRRAAKLRPEFAEAYVNLGDCLADLGRSAEALQDYDRALTLMPEFAELHFNRGVALQELGLLKDAAMSFERALELKPGYAKAHNNLGNVHLVLRRFDRAAGHFRLALASEPQLTQAHVNLGIALQELDDPQAALECHERALALQPGCAEAHYNRGIALHGMGRLGEACDSHDRALLLKPGFARAHEARGHASRDMKRHEEAIASYGRALALEPRLEYLPGVLQHVRMTICDWRNFDSEVGKIVDGALRDERTSLPFPLLALADSPEAHRRSAAGWVAGCCPPTLPAVPRQPVRTPGGSIRVGYFSTDFRDHPVSTLTAELFELHDRAEFEVTAFSLGPDTQDAMRRRMELAFDRFRDVRGKSCADIAALSRAEGIDIAVDLSGLTGDGRMARVFALRPAPLQVGYLGYLGTLGAPFMDYLIADPTLVPPAERAHYLEKIIFLPSYQPNDSRRAIAERRFSRSELGLPATGTVFCCFNANYKITPETWDSWMRILRSVDGSVLFLSADSDAGRRNLEREARCRGVDAGRLVFGGRLSPPEYLARYRVADLFLDTLPYNGGTTASDALWAGLPVLTMMGRSFASRMAASLLRAVGLPELITTTRAQYEELAVALANEPVRLCRLRDHLAANGRTAPLFNTPVFARRLEAAYRTVHQRHLAGLEPADIAVD